MRTQARVCRWLALASSLLTADLGIDPPDTWLSSFLSAVSCCLPQSEIRPAAYACVCLQPLWERGSAPVMYTQEIFHEYLLILLVDIKHSCELFGVFLRTPPGGAPSQAISLSWGGWVCVCVPGLRELPC